uniref:Nucleoside/nucleotide kinase family protein n=1 Tax=Piromyces sp. TaxID=45796 RepID=A0A2S1TYZ7_PIRSP|nr:nucleoside/nucleotide kinase family protein [Piromyces sp.]
MIDYKININGLDVDAHYTEANVKEIFIPLLEKLTELQKKKSKRILVILAAPPGAGKSTLCSYLEKLSKETENVKEIQAIGMDGFHRLQEYLTSHKTIRDGEEILMVKIKGAPETFDLPLLIERIQKVTSGENCGWPIYDRTLHNPVDNVITVTSDIILLEGNYLLLNESGWTDIEKYADYTILLKANEDMLRNRLINRKAASGNSIEVATSFVDYSDMVNVRTCLQKSKKADLILEVLEDSTYKSILN